MINLGPKAKVSKAPKKKARKASSRVARRPVGYFALSPEDVAEMNMFGLAAAQMTVAAEERRQAELKAKSKTTYQAERRA